MGKHLKVAAPEVKIQEPMKIVLGFSELRQCSYIYASNDGKFFIRFIERLKNLCTLTWNQVYISSRHSFGTETIMKENLNPPHNSYVLLVWTNYLSCVPLETITLFSATAPMMSFRYCS